MFDIGWSEMMVIAVIALIIIGPKDLPRVLRTVGHWVRRAQSLAREFQRGVDDMMRESELDEARKLMDARKHLDPKQIALDTVDPTGSVEKEAGELQSEVSDKGARRSAEGSEGTSTSDGSEKAGSGEGTAEETAKSETAGESSGPEAPRDGEDAPKATVIKHPVQIAPPHSVTPPSEPSPESETPASDDGSQKTA